MDKEQIITSGQLFILLFVSKISSVLLNAAAFPADSSVWGLFLPVVVFTALSFLLLLPVLFFRRSVLSGENLPAEKILTVTFLIYFSYSVLRHLHMVFSFLNARIGTDMNPTGLMIFFILVVLYASVKGLESIVRFSAAVFVALLLAAGIMTFNLFPSYQPENIPLSSVTGRTGFSEGMLTVLTGAEDFAVLFLLSSMAKGKFYRCAGCWIFFQQIFSLSMILLIGCTMGNYLNGMSFPFFRSIEGSEILQRMTPFFFGVVISAAVCRVAADFYLILRLMGNFSTEQQSVRRVYYPFIILLSGLAFRLDRTTAATLIFDRRVVVFTALIAGGIIPLTTVLFMSLKKHNRRAAKGIAMLLCVGIIVSFSGCSSVQLNQRLIVQGIGIDKTEDGNTMTFIVLDTESHENDNAVKILFSEGENVVSAMESLEQQWGRKILLTQCLFIIMNEEAALSEDTLSCFRENHEIMKTVNLMLSENSQKTITTAIRDYGYTAEQINGVSNSKVVSGSSAHFSLFDEICCRKESSEMKIPYIILRPETKSLWQTEQRDAPAGNSR